MLVRRIVANTIDLFVLIGGTVLGVYLSGFVTAMFEEPFFLLTLSQVCLIVLFPMLLQALFWMEGTTIGKMMTFCEVVNENSGEKLDFYTMLIREHFSKILSCYLVCLPVFVRKPGIHELATHSRVILKAKKKAREVSVNAG